jgi:hypothetical protein
LNSTAQTVFNHCDGTKTFADADLPKDVIYLSVNESKRNGLIEDNYDSPFAGMNRREVIRRVGFASMIAQPVILSLIAPTAAHVASGCPRTFINEPSGCLIGDISENGTCANT